MTTLLCAFAPCRNTRSPATAIEPYPLPRLFAVQSTRGPPPGHSGRRPVSLEMRFRSGPCHCGQSGGVSRGDEDRGEQPDDACFRVHSHDSSYCRAGRFPPCDHRPDGYLLKMAVNHLPKSSIHLTSPAPQPCGMPCRGWDSTATPACLRATRVLDILCEPGDPESRGNHQPVERRRGLATRDSQSRGEDAE